MAVTPYLKSLFRQWKERVAKSSFDHPGNQIHRLNLKTFTTKNL
jgi:hypothetical protein